MPYSAEFFLRLSRNCQQNDDIMSRDAGGNETRYNKRGRMFLRRFTRQRLRTLEISAREMRLEFSGRIVVLRWGCPPCLCQLAGINFAPRENSACFRHSFNVISIIFFFSLLLAAAAARAFPSRLPFTRMKWQQINWNESVNEQAQFPCLLLFNLTVYSSSSSSSSPPPSPLDHRVQTSSALR